MRKNKGLNRLTILLILVLMFSNTVNSYSTNQLNNSTENTRELIMVYTTSREDIAELSSLGMDIAQVEKNKVGIIAGPADLKKLEANGFEYFIDPEANSILKNAVQNIRASGYHSFADTEQELKDTAANYPDLCKLEIIGKSVEGRPIYALKIAGDVTSDKQVNKALIMGLHHAREWISAEIPLAVIRELTTKYSSDPVIRDYLDTVAIWVVPIVNPDGYVYSQSKDLYWRKNRRVNSNGTYGVDINRNYGYMWGLEGASDNPGDEDYHGTASFSEPETTAISELARREKFKISISFHSSGELVLYPFGYETNAKSPDEPTLKRLATAMAKLNGYTAGPSWALYPAMGDSDDWLNGSQGVLPFTFEVGTSFIPPASEIDSICAQNIAPVLYLIDRARYDQSVNYVAPSKYQSNTISGYIKPDFSFSSSSKASILSGFRVEVEGTDISALTDDTGFFELKNIPVKADVYRIKISKSTYLSREISSIVLTEDKIISSKEYPIDIWSGDFPINNTQNDAINIADVMQVAMYFNTAAYDTNYNADADINKDGAVNMNDIMIVIRHFNTVCESYPVLPVN